MQRYSIKILDSKIKIMNNISKALETDIANLLRSKIPKIESEVKAIVQSRLMICPEILSLKAGTLRLDFGIPIDPTDQIIYSIVNSIHAYFRNFRLNKKSVSTILSIYIQPSDFKNLLENAYGIVITEQLEPIPWLEWLLTGGDAVQITGWQVDYGDFSGSRTGGAIMVPVGFFKVDSQFSGTEENNFITRALSNIDEDIYRIIRGVL